MEIAFSEKISPQLSAALLSTPYELGKEGGLSSGYLPESDSWEVIVKYVGDIEKIKENNFKKCQKLNCTKAQNPSKMNLECYKLKKVSKNRSKNS